MRVTDAVGVGAAVGVAEGLDDAVGVGSSLVGVFVGSGVAVGNFASGVALGALLRVEVGVGGLAVVVAMRATSDVAGAPHPAAKQMTTVHPMTDRSNLPQFISPSYLALLCRAIQQGIHWSRAVGLPIAPISSVCPLADIIRYT